MRQLVLRAAQIKDPRTNLWQGFEEMIREDATTTYRPDIRMKLHAPSSFDVEGDAAANRDLA